MTIEKRLQKLRELKGWNKKEAALRLDTKYTTYVGYESGEREPGHTFLIKAATLYGVTTDYLLGMTDESYVEAALMVEGKLADLPDEDRQMIDDLIEIRHQKWLKDQESKKQE